MRAAGLDFDERDVWGKKEEPNFMQKDPALLTPMLEERGFRSGSLWESCAIMQYLCNKHGLTQFYPEDPSERAMVDSAMFYLIGTLYPLVARATYPTLGFPQYAGEVATSAADDEMKAKAAKDAEAAIAQPLEVYREFFLDGRKFIGGDSPSIADIRLAATLEFLRADRLRLPAVGRGVHGARWSRRSATPTASRPATCAASSSRSRRADRPVSPPARAAGSAGSGARPLRPGARRRRRCRR